jgi:AraC-like DNA-binding protein
MPDTIDIVLRTVTVMTALLLGLLLLASGPKHRASVPGAFFSFAVAAFFMTSIPGGGPALGTWGYALTGLCVTKAVWFWLFARALFNDGALPEHRHLLLVASVALAGAWQQTVFLPAYRSGAASQLEAFAGFGFESLLLVFVLLGLYEAWRDLAIDLVERRRRLRLGFMIAAGVYLAVSLGVQAHNLLLGESTPLVATRANMVVVAAGCVIAAFFLLQFRNESWLSPAQPPRAPALNRTESAVLTKLERALEADRVYLQEGLTIGTLARQLGASEHVLRNVINRGMGYRNFNDFLHAWRIREACEELSSPEHAREPVLAIAMKVGYGSIGAFNRAFKERIGMTPTAYRRKSAGKASLAR